MTSPTEVLKKVCVTCKREKEIGEYHKHKALPDGHVNQCKPCRLEAIKLWRKNNPDKVRATRKRYQATDKCKAMWKRQRIKYPEKRKEILDRWKAAHPERLRYYDLKRSLKRRGMDFDEYESFAKEHGNICGICGAPPESKERRLAIDHCHRTEKNRGLLCINCNSMIGMCNDSIEILEKAIEYLKKHGGQ